MQQHMQPPPGAPEGWEAHWSRTFSRFYFWNTETNVSVWRVQEQEAPALTGEHNNHEYAGTHHSVGASTDTAYSDGGVDDTDNHYYDFGDGRIGFPRQKPLAEPFMHGWVYPPLAELLQRLCGEQTNVIVELGSWLGYSTRLLAQLAPQAKVYAVDYWDNEYIQESTQAQGNNVYVGIDDHSKQILDRVPLYETFLVNLWPFRHSVFPMRMDTVEAMERLRKENVDADLVYVDADRRYDNVKRDIEAAARLFENAVIVGSDYDYRKVRNAVDEVALQHGLDVYSEGGKYWAFYRVAVTD